MSSLLTLLQEHNLTLSFTHPPTHALPTELDTLVSATSARNLSDLRCPYAQEPPYQWHTRFLAQHNLTNPILTPREPACYPLYPGSILHNFTGDGLINGLTVQGDLHVTPPPDPLQS